MKTFTINELRGMVAEGCQGHSEANAALAELARRAEAAPELLAALREMLEACPRPAPLAARRPRYLAAVDAARAAIARAEGRG